MIAKTKQRLLRIALVATAPFLLITCLLCLFLLNTVNPMQLEFITSFEIENRTQQPLWVTPVGTSRSGGKSVLPQYAASFPAIPAWSSRDLRINPGERRRIRYDWDDINFSHIAIRSSDGVVRSLIVDDTPPTDAYYANKADLYSIDDLQSLTMATRDVTAALVPSRHRLVLYPLVIAGIVAPFLFVWLRRRLRELARTAVVQN